MTLQSHFALAKLPNPANASRQKAKAARCRATSLPVPGSVAGLARNLPAVTRVSSHPKRLVHLPVGVAARDADIAQRCVAEGFELAA